MSVPRNLDVLVDVLQPAGDCWVEQVFHGGGHVEQSRVSGDRGRFSSLLGLFRILLTRLLVKPSVERLGFLLGAVNWLFCLTF